MQDEPACPLLLFSQEQDRNHNLPEEIQENCPPAATSEGKSDENKESSDGKLILEAPVCTEMQIPDKCTTRLKIPIGMIKTSTGIRTE